MALIQYLNQINYIWTDRSGSALVDYISLRSEHVKNANLCVEPNERIINNYIDEPFNDIITAHLKCVWRMSTGAWSEAFEEQTSVVQGLLRALQNEGWALPGLVSAAGDLRLVAAALQRLPHAQPLDEDSSLTRPRQPLERAADTLMACFRVCSSDNRGSGVDSRKWGVVALVNQMFKLYFRISKLHLMKPLIRAIDLSPFKDRFPLSQQITYKYFVGRKAMYDSNYTLANEYLSFSFERCHRMSKKNKRLILIYLVPVKILLGYLPSRRVLEKYSLTELWAVREAVRRGSLRELTQAIETNQEFFIRCGIYLILERLRFITYRNLFKQVYEYVGSPVVPLGTLVSGLRYSDSEGMDNEEATCILANLIHQGKVKGYISHSHQKLVLSKVDPFPKLTPAMQ